MVIRRTQTTRTADSKGHSPGVGAWAALEGAARVAWNLATSPFAQDTRRRWGTVETEAVDQLPGDELVPEPKWSTTLAVGVDAPPEAVWPWVAQIGQGRGGFYTYQTLENMAGCKIINTTEILPEHQNPVVGDEIRIHPEVPLRIEIVDPPHALVLFGSPAGDGSDPDKWGKSTWQFIVKPRPDGGSRFLTRSRYDHTGDLQSRLSFGPFFIEPISFVMSTRMMGEIKRLAERNVSSVTPRDHEGSTARSRR